MKKRINVTVWNETEKDQNAYPEGIHAVIADFLSKSGRFDTVRTALLCQPEHGLTQEVLNNTDVLLWWGHGFHELVADEVVDRVHQRVLDGMGLIILHSAHASKIFHRLMGTHSIRLRWRDVGELERVWIIERSHPIMAGLPDYFEVPRSEMYGETFQIPTPDELLGISWYAGGEVFRSACTFKRGSGRIFFLGTGHEDYRIYDIPEVQQIITNATEWAAPFSYPDVTEGYTPESPNALRGQG